MKKEELILKWLDDEPMTAEELEAFKKLDAYNSVVKIGTDAKAFKAPSFDEHNSLQDILVATRKKSDDFKKSTVLPWILRIAAVFIIAFSVYLGMNYSSEEFISSEIAERKTLTLPDKSKVILNAVSTISYHEDKWNDQRKVRLDGEAFFKVAKGKKFDVITSAGEITVLGTQFNVSNRDAYFEVSCYEGLVGVTINNGYHQLKGGEALRVLDNQLIKVSVTSDNPDWLQHRSNFKSTPFRLVIAELERQYGKNISLKNIDSDILFSGNFVHSDLNAALQSITLPMQLTYKIQNNTITLSKE